jgi:hypothetical protein
MSDHGDTIRMCLYGGPPYQAMAVQALDALLVENQRLRDALEQMANEPDGRKRHRILRAALAAVREENER